ncbi:MAG: VWA domain-containing protein [Planctomycetota bacterium]|nr:VWA domain-containing protein [Planctomycetota bacterium]MDA1140440.1 VWA domain-containing protein [Planctomycetota bacterium]
MATSKLIRVRSVPRWMIIPVILSVCIHLVAGGTLPQFWSVDAGYEALKTEINKRYTTMKIIQTPKKMEMTSTQTGAKVKPIEDTPANIEEQINDLIPETIDIPKPGEPGFEIKTPTAIQPARKMWQQEKYEVIRRPAPTAAEGALTSETIGTGTPYSQMDVFNRDIVDQVRFPVKTLASKGGTPGSGEPNTIDENLLNDKSVPVLNLSTLDFPDITTTAQAEGVIQKSQPEIQGFAMTLPDQAPSSLRQTIAEGVNITSIEEPSAEREVEGKDPPDKGKVPAENDDPAGTNEDPKKKKTVDKERRLDLDFSQEQIDAIRTAKPLQPHVVTEFTVFREPGNAQSFFKLEIKAKDGSQLPVIQKNVLFCIDISLSIPNEELVEVRKAVRTYLTEHMHPDDKFNVVRFSEEARRAFYSFVPPDPKNIETGLSFIKKVPGEVKTDVYRVLHSIVLNIFSRYRPCHVFLITDGHSTQGIRDTRRIVQDIAPVTRSNISIFTMDIGSEGNRYLLDLLAYRSRGKLIAADRIEEVEGKLVEEAVRKDKPLLMNLSVNYANLKVDEVYPQILPNLYAGEGVIIYGQCEPGREAAVQIYGQSSGGKWKRFLYPMVVPEGSNGSVEIAKEWARGKIHYLVAMIANQSPPDENRIAEVISLGKKYNLPVPFTE